MALCVAAYGFLVSERSQISPSDDKTLVIKTPLLSNGFRPRRSPDRTERQVKSSITSIRVSCPNYRPATASMPLLPKSQLMTQ
jgi:hypothetical protein